VAMTPQEALERLKEGNRRFVAGNPNTRDLRAEVLATSTGQYPFAAVFSCMDSRVPAEIVLDQGIGDLFSVRIAGNVADTDDLGSLEFAIQVVGSSLILVMGHTNCGAVRGAIEGVKLGNLTTLLERIQPAIAACGPGTVEDRGYVDRVAEANVRHTMKEIRTKSPVLRSLFDSGKAALAGAIYDVATGKVRFLTP